MIQQGRFHTSESWKKQLGTYIYRWVVSPKVVHRSWLGLVLYIVTKKDICKQIWPQICRIQRKKFGSLHHKVVNWHYYGCRCCVIKMTSYIILMWYHLMALRPSIFLRIWHQWVIFAWRASFLLWSFTKPDQHTLRTNFGEMAQVESLVREKSTKEVFHSCHTRDN